MKTFGETHPGAAFVVQDAHGHRFAVYADGRIEGFGPDCLVCNRIPGLIASGDRKSLNG